MISKRELNEKGNLCIPEGREGRVTSMPVIGTDGYLFIFIRVLLLRVGVDASWTRDSDLQILLHSYIHPALTFTRLHSEFRVNFSYPGSIN